MNTVAGSKLDFKMNGMHNMMVWDEKNNTANINTYDVYLIDSIDAVFMPKM